MRAQLFLTVLLIITFSYILNAQQTLLWEISGRKAKGTSYLYGTMHSMDKRAFEFNDSLFIVFERCKAFAMEFTPDEKNMAIVTKHMYLPEGTSLRDLYSDEDYALITEAVRGHLGINIRLLERMKPFFIMSMFVQQTMKADMPTFVDQYLYNLAIEKEMKTISVEKVSEQIKAIEDTPPSVLIEYIKGIGTQESDEMMEALIEAYRVQDLDMMLAISEKDTTNTEMMEALLNVRNITMSRRIEKMVKKQATFVAIGALHLPGNGGVIAILRSRGFTVRPIIAPYVGEKK